MSPNNYESKDIVVLEGLDAVRLRPGMYIGTTGVKGLHHILWEIVDNAIDEISNGYGNRVIVKLNKNGSVSVEDNGRGIPVDMHPTIKKSGVEVVFTKLHAGGKFNHENYGYSGGLHGVGAAVTNALSEWLHATVYKNSKIYHMEFASVELNGKIQSGQPQFPLKEKGHTEKTGTKITFKPDARVFETTEFDFEIIDSKLKELAFLNKGLCTELHDERTGAKTSYQYDGGIKNYVSYLNEGKTELYKEPIYISGESGQVKLELAIGHTDTYTENVFSFVNNIPTSEGGTHETGLKAAITRVMNERARTLGMLKEKEANLQGEDFREGMTVILAIKMRNIQFEGQTKSKLGNPEAKTEVENLVYAGLTEYLEKRGREVLFETIFNKAKGAAKVRESARKAKDLARQKNSIDKYNLVGKLAVCTSRKSELSEIFIVEGDSAGGSAKQGRDRNFQAILPLKGKPLNAEKKRIDQVLANEEIKTIIGALETGVGEDFNINDLRFRKVIILSDADQDGAHIRSILLTFFFRYMRELITEGCVYIGLSPLYKVYRRDTIKYVYNEAELADAIKAIGKSYQIQRFKGLGEMNPEQLWETTMDPARRTLVRVTLDDAARAERMVTTLMGDNIDARKEYIAKHANFDRNDSFITRIKFKAEAAEKTYPAEE